MHKKSVLICSSFSHLNKRKTTNKKNIQPTNSSPIHISLMMTLVNEKLTTVWSTEVVFVQFSAIFCSSSASPSQIAEAIIGTFLHVLFTFLSLDRIVFLFLISISQDIFFPISFSFARLFRRSTKEIFCFYGSAR